MFVLFSLHPTGDLVATYNDLGYKYPVCDVDYHPYDHMVAFCSRGEGQPVIIYTYDSKGELYELCNLFSQSFPVCNPGIAHKVSSKLSKDNNVHL